MAISSIKPKKFIREGREGTQRKAKKRGHTLAASASVSFVFLRALRG
jgi:hypothetical protein